MLLVEGLLSGPGSADLSQTLNCCSQRNSSAPRGDCGSYGPQSHMRSEAFFYEYIEKTIAGLVMIEAAAAAHRGKKALRSSSGCAGACVNVVL